MAKAHTFGFLGAKALFADAVGDVELAVLVDVEPSLAERTAHLLGFRESSADWRAVVARKDIDLIDIVAPNDLHHPMALAAIAEGKHVLCEKPLALTSAQAGELYQAASAAGIHHMVAFTYRLSPAVQLARNLIAGGELGRILQFHGLYFNDFGCDPNLPLSWRFQAARAGSGTSAGTGPHVIDLARYLVGEVAQVAGMRSTWVAKRPVAKDSRGDYFADAGPAASLGDVDVDDACSFLMRFEGEAMGTIQVSRCAPGRKDYLYVEVNGTEGSIVFNSERPSELQFYSSRDARTASGFRTILIGPMHAGAEAFWHLPGMGIGLAEARILQAREMLVALQSGKAPTPSFYDGWQSTRVVDAVVLSADDRRWTDLAEIDAAKSSVAAR